MSEPVDADPAVLAPADPADRPPRFRWRVIPAFLCALYGVLVTLGGLVNVGALFWFLNDSRRPPGPVLPSFLAAGSVTVGGVLLTAGAVALWRGRMATGALLCSAGAVTLAATAWAGAPLPLD